MQAAVITFESLALNALGCFGNTWVRTPHFDRLAARSAVFDQCYASGADLIAALEFLTAQLQQAGGVAVVLDAHAESGDDLDSAVRTWNEAARTGRRALLWIRSRAIRSPWTGPPSVAWTSWQEFLPAEALRDALSALDKAAPAESAERAGPDWNASPEHWIAAALPKLIAAGWLDRQAPAELSRPAMAVRRALYIAAVSELDEWLGRVMPLVQPGNTTGPDVPLVMVTASAGDLLAPHPDLAEGCPPLVAPIVHVPLWVSGRAEWSSTRRSALVSTADVPATAAEWLQLPDRPEETGRSLQPLLRGETERIREELVLGSDSIGWSLRTPDLACVCEPEVLRVDEQRADEPEAGRTWLFVKPDDVWDTLDVAHQYPDDVPRLVARLRELVRGG